MKSFFKVESSMPWVYCVCGGLYLATFKRCINVRIHDLHDHALACFQEDHEVFDTFLVDLLVMAKSCEFCEGCRDSLIRDRIIIGLNDNETINKLLKRPGSCS